MPAIEMDAEALSRDQPQHNPNATRLAVSATLVMVKAAFVKGVPPIVL
jgi:hypothetical protein